MSKRFLPRETWRGWIFNPYWSDNWRTAVALSLGFWILIVAAACAIVGALLFGCGGSEPPKHAPQAMSCQAKGLAVIAAGKDCPAIVAGLRRLVAEDSDCAILFGVPESIQVATFCADLPGGGK